MKKRIKTSKAEKRPANRASVHEVVSPRKPIMKGNLRIDVFETDYNKQALIRPKGFWADVIKVTQARSLSNNDEWKQAEISWSSGGVDGTITDEIEFVNNFIEGLKEAKRYFNKWKI